MEDDKTGKATTWRWGRQRTRLEDGEGAVAEMGAAAGWGEREWRGRGAKCGREGAVCGREGSAVRRTREPNKLHSIKNSGPEFLSVTGHV